MPAQALVALCKFRCAVSRQEHRHDEADFAAKQLCDLPPAQLRQRAPFMLGSDPATQQRVAVSVVENGKRGNLPERRKGCLELTFSKACASLGLLPPLTSAQKHVLYCAAQRRGDECSTNVQVSRGAHRLTTRSLAQPCEPTHTATKHASHSHLCSK